MRTTSPKDSRREGAIWLHTDECQEMDEWSARAGYDLHYQQHDPGRFDAWFNMGLGDDFRIVDQYCNRQVSVVGGQMDDFDSIFLVRNQGDKGVFQGTALGAHSVAVLKSGHEAVFSAPRDLRMLTIQLPAGRLDCARQRSATENLPGVFVASVAEKTVKSLAAVCDKLLGPGGGSYSRTTVCELEEHFVATLTAATKVRQSRKSPPSHQEHVAYVAKARDYIEAHLTQPLGLETLAREAGACPRTLEYSFREILRCCPMQYVKLCRLHATRHDLLRASPEETTVTEVASRYGIDHLSRFAQDFNRQFGELPSNCLRR